MADPKITVTRVDGFMGVNRPLTTERFDTWEEVFASLRARDIPLSAETEAEFRANPSGSQFQRHEFVLGIGAAYTAYVHYDVRVEEPEAPGEEPLQRSEN